MSVIDKLLHKIFGTPHERKVKRLRPVIQAIHAKRAEFELLSDKELAAKSAEFRKRLSEGETLEDIKVEAYAVCQEVCDRRLGVFNIFHEEFGFDFERLGPELAGAVQAAREELRAGKPEYEVFLPAEVYAKVRELYPESVKPFRMMPFDEQLIGGLVLHEGAIAEMATGEGKTLAAACPVYLNGLSGHGVHVVTVNDYLAGRDAKQMGLVYKFLGLKVGLIVNGLNSAQRRESYAADVTYGTNNEFGFDYLRDNMAVDPRELVQRELNFCIVDEVDSILIDEARTPLIISGPAEDATDKYMKADAVVQQLKRGEDFTIDEKNKTAQITERGVNRIEAIMKISNLYGEHAEWVHFLNQSLRAWHLFERDVDYIVRDGEIVIVDENTGRLMEGRRYSEGMHQAIEAKEKVQIRRENQTLATITFQNYFRMYSKLSGMTGTAETEATEFIKIYNMNTWVIPTHKPCIRQDLNDLVYKTEDAKWKAIVAEIKRRHEAGQPMLVGTASVEKSEKISKLLSREGIPHEVLNAKNHSREAEIIQYAGYLNKVTVATNMAGRGTDIALGPGAAEVGGLHVLGTERHESRRIDNQLRGRSGRQGDPGETRFYLSMEDDIMRLFGAERVMNMMESLGIDEDTPIDQKVLSNSIENAQKKVESRNFQSRKNVLEYDDVMNTQRTVIYKQRRQVLDGEDLQGNVRSMLHSVIENAVHGELAETGYLSDRAQFDRIAAQFDNLFYPKGSMTITEEELNTLDQAGVVKKIEDAALATYAAKEAEYTAPVMREVERVIILRVVDEYWMDHIDAMSDLRQGITLRAYGQSDPVVEYKREGYEMFESMTAAIREDTIRRLFLVRIKPKEEIKREKVAVVTSEGGAGDKTVKRQPAKSAKKVGRNDPCPCGSGKKYKNCCLDKDLAAIGTASAQPVKNGPAAKAGKASAKQSAQAGKAARKR